MEHTLPPGTMLREPRAAASGLNLGTIMKIMLFLGIVLTTSAPTLSM